MADHAQETDTAKLTFRLIAGLVVVLLLAVILVALLGLPGLGIFGLLMTVTVFAIMLTFTSGN